MAFEWTVSLVIMTPLLGALAASLVRPHLRPWLGLGSAAAIAVLVIRLWRTHSGQPVSLALGGWPVPLGIGLTLDGFSLVMLAMTALVGSVITLYSWAYFSETPAKGAVFWPLWLAVWAALNALYLSSDLFNLYVTLELLGLGAVGLAALHGKGPGLAAAIRYLLVALGGSLLYLLGVALIYSAHDLLDWRLLHDAVEPGAVSRTALALMTVGLALKAALFPFHFWLPPAHANSSAPVSALLSALVIKGSFYIVARLWLWTFPLVARADAYQVLAALGAVGVLWGSVVALRQKRLKLLVAYSTVAQVGYFFLLFDLVSHPAAAALAWKGGVYLVVAHGCAKAAMFLAAGTIMHAAGHDRLADLGGVGLQLKKSVFAFGLAGASLMGLPPSGGFIGKWLLLDGALSAREWWLIAVLLGGGLLAAGYVFKVIRLALSSESVCELKHRPSPVLEWCALGLAFVAILLGVVSAAPLDLLMESAPPAIGYLEVIP